MASNLSIPKGTRDFNPTEMNRRNYIFNNIKSFFQLYGYSPIETPSFETLSTLMGKYGEEGDKLIFKILNSGEFMNDLKKENIEEISSAKAATVISEKALRYDLTVPFARFVVMHQNEITFPFKRYQIQPVWRADRPQKGRYREFYQCDVDVVGSNSLLYEVEMIQIINDVFEKLGVDVVIKLNNRKILSGIAEVIGEADKIIDITVAIDKLDKIGMDKVIEELKEKGLSDEAIVKLKPILEINTNILAETFTILNEMFKNSEIGSKGVEEIKTVFDYINTLQIKAEVELDLTLARGLNYYTGAIFEVKAKDVKIGSICGGGRYDNLTGIFGLPNVSGVGVSFGADRIYDVLNELNKFPEEANVTTKVMFVNFGNKEEQHCFALLNAVRKAGINAEIYPEAAKMNKQMKYANQKQIPYVILVGENEINAKQYVLKNMITGTQENQSIENIIKIINQ